MSQSQWNLSPIFTLPLDARRPTGRDAESVPKLFPGTSSSCSYHKRPSHLLAESQPTYNRVASRSNQYKACCSARKQGRWQEKIPSCGDGLGPTIKPIVTGSAHGKNSSFGRFAPEGPANSKPEGPRRRGLSRIMRIASDMRGMNACALGCSYSR